MLLAILLFVFVTGSYSAPSTSDEAKRQDLPLFDPPLTHDQIIQIIKDHGNRRQELPLFDPPLTHDQIMQIIKDHIGAKRRNFPLTEQLRLLFTQDQITQLLQNYAQNNLLYKRLFPSSGHVANFVSSLPLEDATWTSFVNDLGYNDILNILGELWKTH